MSIEIINVCPLGCKCEEIKGNAIFRCHWYIALSGKEPQSENVYKDEWRCALAWMPIMLVENAQTNRGQTAALESFRNESVKNQMVFNKIFNSSMNQAIELKKQQLLEDK